MSQTTKQTDLKARQKEGQKLGKAIQKLVGEDNDFILIMTNNKEGTLDNITNLENRIQILGMLEYTKGNYANVNVTKV